MIKSAHFAVFGILHAVLTVLKTIQASFICLCKGDLDIKCANMSTFRQKYLYSVGSISLESSRLCALVKLECLALSESADNELTREVSRSVSLESTYG